MCKSRPAVIKPEMAFYLIRFAIVDLVYNYVHQEFL